MKIIGMAGGQYIATVSHDELEKFFNLYYGHKPRLQIGEEVDLGKGYDFASQCRMALDATSEFVKKNQQVVSAIMHGLNYAAIARETPPASDQVTS